MANVSVSYDGFRPDFFHRNVTPFLNELRMNNTHADYLRNVYPSLTFPNHQTILTGVHPEDHGLTANNLYDFELARPLNYSEELFRYPSDYKPLWLLNQLNGGYSGCMRWPGSEFPYDDVHCTYIQPYGFLPKFTTYIDKMFEWINYKERPANLLLFHLHEPDSHAHAYGPDHPKVTESIAALDEVSKYLYDKIQDSGQKDRINVVCMSDHGMASISEENIIDLSEFIEAGTAMFYGASPNLQVVPADGHNVTEIYEKLLAASKTNGHFKVYTLENMPKHWRLHNKHRVGPIITAADIGYGFQDMHKSMTFFRRLFSISKDPAWKYGIHGYDSSVHESMHSIFFAYGNRIRTQNVVKPFDMVDLFYLFSEILEMPNPNYLRGNRHNILGILKDSKSTSFWKTFGKFSALSEYATRHNFIIFNQESLVEA